MAASYYKNCYDDSWTEKAEEISHVLSSEHIELWKLRELALSPGGLVNDSLRRKAWPKLVGINQQALQQQQQLQLRCGTNGSASPSGGSVAQGSSSPAAGWSNPQTPTSLEKPTRNLRVPNKSRSRVFPPTSPPSPVPPYAVHQCLHEQPFVTSPSLMKESKNTRGGSSSSSMPKKSRSEHRQPRLPPILARSLDSPHVELDVSRCTWHLITGSERLQRFQMENKRQKAIARHIKIKQRRLSNLINAVLVNSYSQQQQQSSRDMASKLRYYQGYHDVACIFLAVLENKVKKDSDAHWSRAASVDPLDTKMQTLGLGVSAAVLAKVSQSHFRTFMQSSFSQLKSVLNLTIFPLLALHDPELHDHLYSAEMTEPTFALPWVITWFAHEIRDTELVKRIFDAFLVSHPLLPLYAAVAMITNDSNRRELLATECDFTSLHRMLASLPKNSSMVGWKYEPGSGYISDNESICESTAAASRHFDDSNEIPLRNISVSYDSDDFLCFDNTTFTSATSLQTFGESEIKVPFQDILDAAVDMMDRVPPKDLLRLATRYHGKQQVKEFLKGVPAGIATVFETPEASQLNATVKADWLLREEAREERVNGKLIREGPFSNKACNKRKLREQSSSRAVVALGCAVGERAKRKRRKRNRAAAAALAMGAVCSIVSVAVMQADWNAAEVHGARMVAEDVTREAAGKRRQQEYMRQLQREEEAANRKLKQASLEAARREETEKALKDIREQALLSMKMFEEEASRRAKETSAETKRISNKAKSDLARLRVKEEKANDAANAERVRKATEAAAKADAERVQEAARLARVEEARRVKRAAEAKVAEEARIAAEQLRMAKAKEAAARAEQIRVTKEKEAAERAEQIRLERERVRQEQLALEEKKRAEEEKRLAIEEARRLEEQRAIEAQEQQRAAAEISKADEVQKRRKAEVDVEEERLQKARAAQEAKLARKVEKAEKARLQRELREAQKAEKAEKARLDRELREAQKAEKAEQARLERELREAQKVEKAEEARLVKLEKQQAKREKARVKQMQREVTAKIPRAAQIGMHNTPVEFLNYFEGGVGEFRDKIKEAPTSRLFRIMAIFSLDIIILVVATFL